MRSTFIALTLVLGGLAAQEPPAAAPDAPKVYDLRIILRVGEPVLVTVSSEEVSELRSKRGDEVLALRSTAGRRHLRAVDEYSQVEEGDCLMSRTILQWEEDEDGKPSEPALIGVRADFHEKSGTPTTANIADERRIAPADMDRLLLQAAGVGPWLALPAAAEVGSSHEIDLAPVAAFLLGTAAQVESAVAQLELQPLGGQDRHATLAGRLQCRWKGAALGIALAFEAEGRLTAEVDLEEHRLLSLTFEAERRGTTAAGSLVTDLTGRGSYRLSTATGEAVTAARDEKPVFRDRTQKLHALGLALDLPSHWFAGNEVEGKHHFATWMPGGGDSWLIELMVFPTEDPELELQGIKETIRSEFPDARFAAITNQAGAGFTTLVTQEGRAVHVLVVAGEERGIRLRLLSPEASQEAAAKDFAKAVATLRPLR